MLKNQAKKTTSSIRPDQIHSDNRGKDRKDVKRTDRQDKGGDCEKQHDDKTRRDRSSPKQPNKVEEKKEPERPKVEPGLDVTHVNELKHMLQELQGTQQLMAAELAQVKGDLERQRSDMEAMASCVEESARNSLETEEQYYQKQSKSSGGGGKFNNASSRRHDRQERPNATHAEQE